MSAKNPSAPAFMRFLSEPLHDRPVTLLHAGRNRTKARLWMVGLPPDALVVKEYVSSPAWMRRLFGRRLLAREARAYRLIEGIRGVPRLIQVGSPDWLVLSHANGLPLPEASGERLTEAFFDRLEELLDEIHARGVACGDLHHRNVIVREDGSPLIVDFAMSFVRPASDPAGTSRFGRALSGWLFRRARELDASALIRIRTRYLRREPTPAEREILARDAWARRAGRALKRTLFPLRRASQHTRRAA